MGMLAAFRLKDIVNAREMLKHLQANGVQDIAAALAILNEHSHPPPVVPAMPKLLAARSKIDLSVLACPSCGAKGHSRWGCLIEGVNRIACRCGYSWIAED